MGDGSTFQINTQPTLQQLIDYSVERLKDPDTLKALSSALADAGAKAQALGKATENVTALVAAKAALAVLAPIHQTVEDLFTPFLVAIVGDLIGVEPNLDDIKGGTRAAGGGAAGNAMAGLLLDAIRGGETELQPGDAGARRLVGFGTSMVLQSWFEGILLDQAIDLIPSIKGVEAISQLGEELVGALGLGRMMRTALRPLIQTLCTTPLQWQVHETFRPTLLGASDLAREVARGTYTLDQAKQELARAGYSDDRIAALLSEHARYLGEGDVQLLVLRGYWTNDQGVAYLQAAGYDKATAVAALRVAGLREWMTIETTTADNIISAYAAGHIDQVLRDQLLTSIVEEPARRNFYESAADARRVASQKPLTSSEAKRLAKAGILAVPDYRDALERENYTPDAVDALELELQQELDAEAKLADLKKEQAAAKLAAATAKAQLAAQKAQAAEAKAAEAERGSVAALTGAFVRGLIPLSRLQEVLAFHDDAETVGILSQLAQAKRAEYVAKQDKAAAALKGHGPKTIAVASLQQAVLDNLLTLDEYRQRLAQLGYNSADVDLLGEVMADKKSAFDQAQKTRAAAAAKAAKRSISLSQFETLVRRGVHPMADYDTLLSSLGYDEADRADLEELLKLKIADDARAAALRKNAPTPAGGKDVTLAELRRAVLLGLKTDDDYAKLLVQLGYSTDAQQTLMGELHDDEASADAARQKRATTTAANGARVLPIATIARAARLGLIPVSVYQDRLTAAGYTPDDIAIDLDLLTTEMADTTAAKKTAARTTVPGGPKPLTLAEVAAAVKHGVKTLDDYRAAAVTAGLSPDAVETQVRVLGDDLRTTADAKARRDDIAGKLQATSTPLAVLDEQVRTGTLSIAGYTSTLEQEGVASDDAALLGGLLASELNAGSPPASA